MDKDFYSFARLTDLQHSLTFRISSLEGLLPHLSRTELLKHPEARHWGTQQSRYPDLYVTACLYADNKRLSVPVRTAYKPFRSNHQWSEWITLPYKLCDLPLNAQLAFTVYDVASSRTTNVIGGTTFRLFSKKGTLKKAQHRLFLWKGVPGDGSAETSTPAKVGTVKDQMGRLEKLIKRHERGDLPRIDWLDKLAFRKIEKVHAQGSDQLWLYIDMPRFELPIVFCEPEATIPSTTLMPVATTEGSTIEKEMFTIVDPEIARENPVEAKHRRLVRSHRSGPLDRELKPNAAVRDELNEILSYPPTRVLSSAEMDRIWSFRFYLTRDPKGLTKFLKSVVWTDSGEAKQATEVLLPMWSEPKLDDALELLGPTFKDPRVRAYAVRQLERADDAELILYLLQLVQALKFEVWTTAEGTMTTSAARDRRNIMLQSRHASFSSQSPSASTAEDSGLADFLIRRGLKNPVLGNNLYWYLVVETEDKATGKLFKKVKQRYLERMGAEMKQVLDRQAVLLSTLSQRAKELRSSRDPRPKKIDKLRSIIADPRNGLSKFDPPLPLPLDAEVLVSGIQADKSTVFKSNLFPLRLSFTLANEYTDLGADEPGEYALIFKNGDDLRQDQLVIQLFTLMDKLLRNENLDLRITPYKVLATGAVDGMVQFVESMSIAGIMGAYNGSLLNYLREAHPMPSSLGTYGVDPAVLDTFVRSCAGYCVVTYLLGVGDRHLDNLLLAPSGHFFHVDFGYILGRDPKPFPPPIKLSKEMVEAMGGTTSPHYLRFKSLCYTAFSILRKNNGLILNLVALMTEANVPDIRVEPDKAVEKVMIKFLLGMGEEEARGVLGGMLDENGYLASVFDRLHGVAQYFRQ